MTGAAVWTGKQALGSLVRYFQSQLQALQVEVRLGHAAGASALNGFDEIVLATGVLPRRLDLPGGRVWTYAEVFAGAPLGRRVAILGGGGIGFEVAEFLSRLGSDQDDLAEYFRDWGIDPSGSTPGFLATDSPPSAREQRLIYLVQRKGSKMGKNLGRTTGWIRSARLQQRGVQLIAGAHIEGRDQRGLVIRIGQRERVLEIDDVVACIGQEPDLRLAQDLSTQGRRFHLLGGVRDATCLSALRAIREGVSLGRAL